ncbi:M4 family metallopeptidase [Streptomyces sp. LX-29]|uniref:M4 family metallopeptidase n=1 Tax=Streptomyces sp. LX-29 TaxID=2900152 RepID=UPI00240DF926|nr:M4 family metallopeptidase [Streptomyces sp. LX-29]WFB07150.1 M4 family metallopeptidase [Streptomyces sp. LX-29]
MAFALAAASALIVTGAQGGAADAAGARRATPVGAEAVPLTPAQRTALIADAQAAGAATADRLGLGPREKLIAVDVVEDADGARHTRYQRTFAGLPVLGGDLVEHRAAGGRTTVTRATAAAIAVPTTTPVRTPATARRAALGAAVAEGDSGAHADRAPRLVVWAAAGRPALAWESVATGRRPDGSPSELHVIGDATTGKELFRYQAVRNGTGISTYSGPVGLDTTYNGTTRRYELIDPKRGNHRTCDLRRQTSGACVPMSDLDDVWDHVGQRTGVDAHYGHAVTWDYFLYVHGRNGIRNDGRAGTSRVNYGNGYVNAFWQDSCFCMTYGDGGGSRPPTSIDVAAHEMSHGVTSATANLLFSAEAGGLNEGTSDIFAASVEFHADNPYDPGDYLIGEKLSTDGTPLRSMDRPSRDGRSKDYWYPGIGSIDVHHSSGVADHFFYLLSEGSGRKVINGVAYDSPTFDGVPVTGIGRAAAEKIWYRALTVYMTSTTDYRAARAATLRAAADLYGQGSAPYGGVAAAWAAVNVK